MTKSGLEALAMSMPLLLSDVPACRELVKPGINGLLVKPKCKNSLAQAIKWMIEKKHRIYDMGTESRKLAENAYSSELIVKELKSIIL